MKKKISIIIVVILIALLGYGYYKYFYVPKGEVFDVKYLNLKKINITGDVTEEKGILGDLGLHTRLKFTQPKDSLTYSFEIVNDGTITAKLMGDPILFGTDNFFKKHIFYELTDNNNEKIKSGDVIKPGETKKVNFKVTYIKDPDFATQDSSNFEVGVYFLYLEDK